jgi:hypothetical protein
VARRRRSKLQFHCWEELNEDRLVEGYLLYLHDMTRQEDADRVQSVASYWNFARGAYQVDLYDMGTGDEPRYRPVK